jgi:hypothetical protein
MPGNLFGYEAEGRKFGGKVLSPVRGEIIVENN